MLNQSMHFTRVLVMTIVIALGLATGCKNKENEKVMAVGEVVQLKGTVKAIGVDKQSRTLQMHSPIYPKDTLYTAKDSYVGLRFTDGTLGVLRPDSVLQVTSYSYVNQGEDSSENRFKLKLSQGSLTINAGHIAREHQDAFQITTPAGFVNLKNPNAMVVYEPKKGLAFKGTGTVQNAKGTRDVIKETYVLVPEMDIIPQLVSKAPPMMTSEAQTTANGYLKKEIKHYGENVSYMATDSYQGIATYAQLTKEDTADDIIASNDTNPSANTVFSNPPAEANKTTAKASEQNDESDDAATDDNDDDRNNNASADDNDDDRNASTDDRDDDSNASDDSSNSDDDSEDDWDSR